MIKAGDLRHLVTIQRLVSGSPQQKPSGEPDTAWADYLTNVSASIEPLRGKELYAAQEHRSEATVRIRMRWRDGITAAMRIVHGGLYYNIVWVPVYDRDGKRVELDLLTTQGVNDG